MELLIETLTGAIIELQVCLSETVGSIKSRIQKTEGIPVAQQHLIWRDKELDDYQRVRDCEIFDGSTLRLVIGMSGGPLGARSIPSLHLPSLRIGRSTPSSSTGGSNSTGINSYDYFSFLIPSVINSRLSNSKLSFMKESLPRISKKMSLSESGLKESFKLLDNNKNFLDKQYVSIQSVSELLNNTTFKNENSINNTVKLKITEVNDALNKSQLSVTEDNNLVNSLRKLTCSPSGELDNINISTLSPVAQEKKEIACGFVDKREKSPGPVTQSSLLSCSPLLTNGRRVCQDEDTSAYGFKEPNVYACTDPNLTENDFLALNSVESVVCPNVLSSEFLFKPLFYGDDLSIGTVLDQDQSKIPDEKEIFSEHDFELYGCNYHLNRELCLDEKNLNNCDDIDDVNNDDDDDDVDSLADLEDYLFYYRTGDLLFGPSSISTTCHSPCHSYRTIADSYGRPNHHPHQWEMDWSHESKAGGGGGGTNCKNTLQSEFQQLTEKVKNLKTHVRNVRLRMQKRESSRNLKEKSDEPNGVNITIPNNDRLSNVDGKILRSDFVENAQSITPINVTPHASRLRTGNLRMRQRRLATVIPPDIECLLKTPLVTGHSTPDMKVDELDKSLFSTNHRVCGALNKHDLIAASDFNVSKTDPDLNEHTTMKDSSFKTMRDDLDFRGSESYNSLTNLFNRPNLTTKNRFENLSRCVDNKMDKCGGIPVSSLSQNNISVHKHITKNGEQWLFNELFSSDQNKSNFLPSLHHDFCSNSSTGPSSASFLDGGTTNQNVDSLPFSTFPESSKRRIPRTLMTTSTSGSYKTIITNNSNNDPKRCSLCVCKIGITNSYTCQCGMIFCPRHRYAETHNCKFDYKAEGKRVISQSNPVITASKLPKI